LALSAGEQALMVSVGAPSTANELDTKFGSLARFVRQHVAEFGFTPGLYAAEAFDAATLLIDGFKAQKEGVELGRFIRNHRPSSTTKSIRLNEQGDLTNQQVYVYEVRNGHFVCERTISVTNNL
jgi:branched-chain amino acid transport system substrate-binding protein